VTTDPNGEIVYWDFNGSPGNSASIRGGTFSDLNKAFTFQILGSELAQTPLPAALPLFATGLGALGLVGWRRKRKAAAIPFWSIAALRPRRAEADRGQHRKATGPTRRWGRSVAAVGEPFGQSKMDASIVNDEIINGKDRDIVDCS
jgi:hypothetical protein